MVCVCTGIAIALIVVSITAYLLSTAKNGRKYNLFRLVVKTIKELSLNSVNCRRKYKGNPDLTGKVVVITGANTGIGKVTALEMAKRGASVIIGCRDMQKGNNAIEDIKQQYPNANIRAMKLDLSSLKSVRQFAKQVCDEVKQIDILINNAGIMMCPKWKTEDGFEMQFGTNHLGHFLLTLLLLDRIKAAPKARIVVVSSTGHLPGVIHFDDINLDKNYDPSVSYQQSKLANVLFAKELARKLKSTNITVYSLHPGIIRTDLVRHIGFFGTAIGRVFQCIFLISPELGAQTSLYCALEESIANESGHYYDNCKRVNDCDMTSNVTDETARKLWDLSADLVKLEDRLVLN